MDGWTTFRQVGLTLVAALLLGGIVSISAQPGEAPPRCEAAKPEAGQLLCYQKIKELADALAKIRPAGDGPP